jgi:GT2 family glycosyltransferase
MDSAEILLVAARGSDIPGDLGAGIPDGIEARWLLSPPGRARQQNVGAAATDAPWLWFVHADSRVAPSTLPALRRVVRAYDDAGAAQVAENALHYFNLRFLDDGPPWMAINSFGAWIRSRGFGLPFGDQGFLLPSALFHALGGFDESVPFGEDHALVWAAHRAGVPVRAIGAPLLSSARKYAENGWLATTARHLRMTWQQARIEARRPKARVA